MHVQLPCKHSVCICNGCMQAGANLLSLHLQALLRLTTASGRVVTREQSGWAAS
jgi:hypothetical protein